MAHPTYTIETEEQYKAFLNFLLEEESIFMSNVENGGIKIRNAVDEETRTETLKSVTDLSINDE